MDVLKKGVCLPAADMLSKMRIRTDHWISDVRAMNVPKRNCFLIEMGFLNGREKWKILNLENFLIIFVIKQGNGTVDGKNISQGMVFFVCYNS